MHASNQTSVKRQQGSTLLVAVVILLLASLMGLMAMNVGVFEQRSSGNDLRAKLVHQAAEAGLAQGFEHLMRVDRGTSADPTYSMIDDDLLWESCAGKDDFPCTAVPAAVKDNMYRLAATGYTIDGLDIELSRHMLQLPAVIAGTDLQDIAYGVAPVLCRVPMPVASKSISCSTDTDKTKLSDRRVVTFVSVAQIRDDAGRTTLTQTVALSSLLAQPGGVPTIIASGTVVPPGNGDVVAMPDAAGPGLDVAVWSRLDVKPASGTFATCSRQDFLASGQQSLTDADWIASRTCDKCGCGMAKKAATAEDWDILDVDSNSGTNRDVVTSEFPCDLFEYAFNVAGWQDDDGDNFCETRKPTVAFEAPDGITYQLYPEEAFLYENATKIKPTSGNVGKVRASQLFTGNVGSTDKGLIWCQQDCLPNTGTVGSVTEPVAVVADAGTNTPLHATVFGLLFYKSTGDAALDPTTGGNAGMQFNAGSAVYGSLVVQGQILTGSGGGLLYGDADILKALGGLDEMTQFDTLRGGWTDRNSY